MTSTMTANGWYAAYPEGGDTEYYRIRGGRAVEFVPASDIEDHVKGRDNLAFLGDATWVDIADRHLEAMLSAICYGNNTCRYWARLADEAGSRS